MRRGTDVTGRDDGVGARRGPLLSSVSRRALLALAVALPLGMSLPREARAQVTVNPVQTSTYYLTASANPITFGPATNINVASPFKDGVEGNSFTPWNVTNAGRITAAGTYGNDGVELQTGGTVTNSGTITATGGTDSGGVVIWGGAGAVTNSGTITATGTNGEGVSIGGGAGVVTNSGTITATGTETGSIGVALLTGTVINQASGTISGGSWGVSIGNGGTVANSGTISGGGAGVGIWDGVGVVTNSGTITATGTDSFGVGLLTGTVINQASGTISGGGWGGVSIWGGAGAVTNSGTITGAGTGSAGVVMVTGTVINSGNITATGTNSIGVNIWSGPGAVTNSGTITATGTSTGTYGAGVTISGGAGVVTNSGTITATGTSVAGVGLLTGTVINQASGKISSSGGWASVGFWGGAGAVTNAGTITATGTHNNGVELLTGTVINQASGTISSTSGWGVLIWSGAGTVTNAGTITAAGTTIAGVNIAGGAGTVTNSGTITATGTYTSGVSVRYGAGTVTNSGTITASGGMNGAGVYISRGAGAVTNSGTIRGETFGVTISGPGQSTGGGGSITNYAGGTIIGDIGVAAWDSPITVTNAGSITGTTAAASLTWLGVPVTSGDGVSLNAGGAVTNQTGGTIAGARYGVYVTGGAGTVTNAGTIGGASGSVVFAGSGLNTLTLQTGSVLNGDAIGSAAGGATNALILQGSGEADNNFLNFNTLNVEASGAWTLGGDSTIGATEVAAGTLIVTGALTSAFTIDSGATLQGNTASLLAQGGVTDNGTLVFNQATSGTFANAITGSGSLIKQNIGALTLSGIDTYTGATTVNGGALEVDGAIANSSSVTVNEGATLSGIGIVDPITTSIANGGTLAPGNATNPTGALTITGNLIMANGSFYQIAVTPSASSFASVSGVATPGGATVEIAPGSSIAFHQTYTILTAKGGVSGTFDPTVVPGSAKATLSYDADDAYLTFTTSTIAAFLPGCGGSTEFNVATALDKFANNVSALPAEFGTLYSLPAPQLASALAQLSGEATTGAQRATFDAMNGFVGMFFDGVGVGDTGTVGGRAIGPASVPSGALAYDDPTFGPLASGALAAATPRDQRAATIATPAWSVWSQSYGASSTTDGNCCAGSSTTTSQTYGLVVGADYRLSPDTVLGFGLGGGGTSFGLAGGLGGGRSDLLQAGVYGLHNFGADYIGAAAAYGWQDVTTNRAVTVGSSESLQAKFDANTFVARAEAGDRFAMPAAGVTPYGALQATTILLPSYAESAPSGGSTFALSYASQTVTDARTELGARFDKSFALSDALLTLAGRLAWAHDFEPSASAVATFQSLPGASFTVNGATPSPDSALVSAGAQMKWANGFSALASFEGEFSSNTRSYGGKGTLRYTW